MVVGSLLFLFMLFAPIPLPGTQKRLLSVLFLTFSLWISEALPLPVTALLAMVLIGLWGILPAEQAFSSFANPIISCLQAFSSFHGRCRCTDWTVG